MRRWILACLLLASASLCASCGDDDDDDRASPCDTVCACVQDRGGDVNYCYDECAKSLADEYPRASCEIKLGIFGLSECNATCEALPVSS